MQSAVAGSPPIVVGLPRLTTAVRDASFWLVLRRHSCVDLIYSVIKAGAYGTATFY